MIVFTLRNLFFVKEIHVSREKFQEMTRGLVNKFGAGGQRGGRGVRAQASTHQTNHKHVHKHTTNNADRMYGG